MYRVLCIGDPHIRQYYKEDGDSMREVILQKARALAPDRIVVLGDLTHDHSRVHLMVLGDATDFIYDLSEIAPTDVLIGNHDMINNSQFCPTYHPFTGIRNQSRINIVSKRTIVEVPELGKSFIFLPYIPDGRLQEALPFGLLTGEVAAVFCHQTFRGARYGGRIAPETSDYWPRGAPLVISGHIHEYQWLAPNILYVGTPMQHEFGDLSEKSLSMMTFTVAADGSIKHTEDRIRLGLRERKVLHIHVDNVYEWTPGTDTYKLYIDGPSAQVRVFFLSSKHRELQSMGVTMLEGILSDVASSIAETDLSIATAKAKSNKSYTTEVRDALGDNERATKWLSVILESPII